MDKRNLDYEMFKKGFATTGDGKVYEIKWVLKGVHSDGSLIYDMELDRVPGPGGPIRVRVEGLLPAVLRGIG